MTRRFGGEFRRMELELLGTKKDNWGMKFGLPLIFLLSCVSVASGQKKEQPAAARNVTIIVDMIGVSRADAFNLVRLDSPTMWAKVREMVQAGSATSEYMTSVTGVSDERHIVECINEMRYPTEFQPPEGIAADFSTQATPPSRSEAIQAMITPTVFETRNRGGTMEVITRVEGENLLVEMIPSWTRFIRFLSFPLGTKDGFLKADQPEFQTVKIQTKVILKSGGVRFIGAGDLDPAREGKDADKIVLIFVTGTLSD